MPDVPTAPTTFYDVNTLRRRVTVAAHNVTLSAADTEYWVTCQLPGSFRDKGYLVVASTGETSVKITVNTNLQTEDTFCLCITADSGGDYGADLVFPVTVECFGYGYDENDITDVTGTWSEPF